MSAREILIRIVGWFLLGVLLCYLASFSAHAETCTSTGSGNWSGAIWSGCTPDASDSYVLSTGHTVALDSDITFTGPIAVQTGATLQGSGARVLTLNNVALSVAAGGSITNTGGVFEIKIGSAHSQTGNVVQLVGSTGSHVTVAGESATNHIKFTDGGYINGGRVTASYTDFSNIGTVGSVKAFAFWGDMSFTHCTFASTVADMTPSTSLNTNFVVEDSTFLSTGTNIGPGLFSTTVGSKTRSIQRNWFGGMLGTLGSGGNWRGLTFKHNVIKKQIIFLNTTDVPDAFEYNLIQKQVNSDYAWPFSTTVAGPNYLHIHSDDDVAIDNPHGINPNGAGGAVAIRGWIIEPGNTNQNGDLIMGIAPSSGLVVTAENNLFLSTQDGLHGGQAVSLQGNANLTYAVNHNTYFPSNGTTGESGAISYGENYAGHAGILSSIKSNLVARSPSGTGGFVFQRRSLYTVADGAAAADVANNGKYNLTTGDYGVGYDDTGGTGMFSSGSPGANDLVADPNFVDWTRKISTWAVMRGYTSASGYNDRSLAAYEALKTDTANRLVDLITWVRDGYLPQNPSFWCAGHDGASIGAIDYCAKGKAFLGALAGF